jgi:hypothetical protein
MHAIILGGESPQNKKWTQAAADAMEPIFGGASVLKYKQWTPNPGLTSENPGKNPIINITAEAERLAELAEKHGPDYVILAKSVGCWAALKALKQDMVKPDLVILAGVPILPARRIGVPINYYLTDYAWPTQFIQNAGDPVIGAEDLQEELTAYGAQNFEVAATPGNSHRYNNVALLGDIASRYAAAMQQAAQL